MGRHLTVWATREARRATNLSFFPLYHCKRFSNNTSLNWESQFLGRLIRSPGSLRRTKGSGVLKEEIGVWNSQGGGMDSLLFYTPWSEVKWSEATLSCLTLWDPMDCSPPGSSVHGIFQASILERVAFSFSRDLPNPGIKSGFPALQADALPSKSPGKPLLYSLVMII